MNSTFYEFINLKKGKTNLVADQATLELFSDYV
jgi:hypothetical protein